MNNITITAGISQVFFVTITDSGRKTTYMRMDNGSWWQFVDYFLTCSYKLVDAHGSVSRLETIYQQWKNSTNDSPKLTTGGH